MGIFEQTTDLGKEEKNCGGLSMEVSAVYITPALSYI